MGAGVKSIQYVVLALEAKVMLVSRGFAIKIERASVVMLGYSYPSRDLR